MDPYPSPDFAPPSLHIRFPLTPEELEGIKRIMNTSAIGPNLKLIYMVRFIEQIKGAAYDSAKEHTHG